MGIKDKRTASAVVTFIAAVVATLSIYAGVHLIQAKDSGLIDDRQLLLFEIGHGAIIIVAVAIIIRLGKRVDEQ